MIWSRPALVGLYLGLSTAIFAARADEKPPIRIAIAGPMTGGGAAFGLQMRLAAELKTREANEAGGLHGRKVELLIEDDQSQPAEATRISLKLTGDPTVLAVVGHFNSSCSFAGKPAYNRVGLVQLTPGSTHPDVCRDAPYTFRNLYRDDQQGTFLARFARRSLSLKRVAVIHQTDGYGSKLKDAFVREAGRVGMKVVALESYEFGQTLDFRTHLARVKTAGADGVFIAGLYPEAALILRAARDDARLAIPAFGGDGLYSQDLIAQAGAAANGTYFTTPFLFEVARDSPPAKAFLAAFRKLHRTDPDTWAAQTYDALGHVLQAIAHAGPERKAIRDHLAGQTTADKGYRGVTGVTYFDAEGDCPDKPLHVVQVIAGKFAASPKQLLEWP